MTAMTRACAGHDEMTFFVMQSLCHGKRFARAARTESTMFSRTGNAPVVTSQYRRDFSAQRR
jgi:hypothetical protein